MKYFPALVASLALIGPGFTTAEMPTAVPLRDGDRLAVLGDSITEQKNYSAMLEMYLLACQPAARLQASQFGWGGETTWAFVPRIEQDVLWFKPTVATVAYGMNDGGYGPVDPKRLSDYKASLEATIDKLRKAGTRLVVIGGPGVVDADAYKPDQPGAAAAYNKTLAAFNEAAREVATAKGAAFADLNTVMAKAMARYKGHHPDKSFVGKDGIHPEGVGHTVMAYAFLKALGCDGDLGTLTVDLATDHAEATGGHKIVSMKASTLTVESPRFPFQAKRNGNVTGVRAAMEVIPFQEELNRFRLLVRGVPEGRRVKLTWSEVPAPGSTDGPAVEVSKTFDAAVLAEGINLSSEFDTTPFEHAWARLDSAVRAQQDFETPLTKKWLHQEKDWAARAPSAAQAATTVAERGKQLDADLRAMAGAVVSPVTHTLRFSIEP